ncbi:MULTISPECIES: HigA family addiction module antitoxin [Methylomonas]|uniref:HTH cro/C1-type domain-containing protein n=2 Tax=Methylomonas TaxID=416 RepID=A0A140E4Q3_9GAMM|nr:MULTISPECIES: HigA family addiction module antitoxin [Methylomonas]AMK75377.1 hypothetical protein JT25_002550 [Methylomonas denitrificans]OAI08739.1 hypothetical protein A1342_00105 [Methylomonas methanica]TCV72468.1 addiction module HigA family antidote [Methylomonas methanica]
MKDETTPIHPGQFLKIQVLEKLALGIDDTAIQLRIKRESLSRILNGHRNISVEMALKLEALLAGVTGATAADWLRMQAEYDIYQKSKDLVNTIDELKGEWIGFYYDEEYEVRPNKEEIETRKILSSNLKKSRDELKINLNEASKKLGVSLSFLKDIEGKGKRLIPISFLAKASVEYLISIDHLLGLSDDDSINKPDTIERLSQIKINTEIMNKINQENILIAKVDAKVNRISTKFIGLSDEVYNLQSLFNSFCRDNQQLSKSQGMLSLKLAVINTVDRANQYNGMLRRYKIL